MSYAKREYFNKVLASDLKLEKNILEFVLPKKD
jgi:hypothetical protein